MGGRKRNSIRIALGGLLGALSLVMMLSGSILPLATFLAPTISGVLLVPVAIEFGMGTGLVLYAAVSILSFFMVPDKEMALVFIFFLGYYPLIKPKLDSIRAKMLCYCAKLAAFNLSVVAMYCLILYVFPIPYLVAEMKQWGVLFAVVLLVCGNVTFVIYDIALVRFERIYREVWRPRLMRFH